MVAMTFLSAAELNLDEKERDALIGVLRGLERGWFVHAQPKDDLGYDVGLAFNMVQWDCGTTACIAGWCDVLYKTSLSQRYSCTSGLEDLFMPRRIHRGWETITPKQAARALRSYLATGKPHWGEALKAPRQRKVKPVVLEERHGQVDQQGQESPAEHELRPAGQGQRTGGKGQRLLPDSGRQPRQERTRACEPAR